MRTDGRATKISATPGHSDYIRVDSSQELWRYASIGELKDLLKGVVRLTCPILWRADDPYEGFLFSNEVISVDGRKLDTETEGRKIYVQCWSKVLREHHHMWQLYGNKGKGVILRTTAEKLLGSVYCLFDISENEFLTSKIGAVQYLHESEISKVLSDPSIYKKALRDYHLISLLKRSAYISEEEVRLIVHDFDGRNRRRPLELANRIAIGTSADYLHLKIGIDKAIRMLTGVVLGANLNEPEVIEIRKYCEDAGIDSQNISQSRLYSPKGSYRIDFSAR